MNAEGPKAIFADRIFTGEEWLEDHAIFIENGIIGDLVPASSLSSEAYIQTYPGHFIAPAFIDLQIYGAHGRLLAVYPDPETLKQIVRYSREGGAANCLPALASNHIDIFYRAIDAVREYWKNGGEGISGLHLEGPWINPEKRGAHLNELIHSPELNEVKELLDRGQDVIRMITLAPEVCNKEVIDLILSRGVIISAGHSQANYREAADGFAHGIKAVTHLFNAMSPLQHREPGLVGATLNDDHVMASIIPDGYHVNYEVIRIAKKIMEERLFVITDAVTATTEGHYPHQLAGDKYEASGILSGSALTMFKSFQNLVNHVGVEPGEALRMCSLYPARLLKREDLGKIKSGAQGKLVLIDNGLLAAKLI